MTPSIENAFTVTHLSLSSKTYLERKLGSSDNKKFKLSKVSREKFVENRSILKSRSFSSKIRKQFLNEKFLAEILQDLEIIGQPKRKVVREALGVRRSSTAEKLNCK